MTRIENNGFFVHGEYTTIAWYRIREKAEAEVRRLRYKGINARIVQAAAITQGTM